MKNCAKYILSLLTLVLLGYLAPGAFAKPHHTASTDAALFIPVQHSTATTVSCIPASFLQAADNDLPASRNGREMVIVECDEDDDPVSSRKYFENTQNPADAGNTRTLEHSYLHINKRSACCRYSDYFSDCKWYVLFQVYRL